jgi:hypothetical protein
MTTGVKILIGTIGGFLAVAYSWIFRARKVQSGHVEGDRDRADPGDL